MCYTYSICSISFFKVNFKILIFILGASLFVNLLFNFWLRFLGSSWASFLYGWGNLLCMYLWVAKHQYFLLKRIIKDYINWWRYVHCQYRFNSISRVYFFAITAGLSIWIGVIINPLSYNRVLLYFPIYWIAWGFTFYLFLRHHSLMFLFLMSLSLTLSFCWQDLHFGRTVRHMDILLRWSL